MIIIFSSKLYVIVCLCILDTDDHEHLHGVITTPTTIMVPRITLTLKYLLFKVFLMFCWYFLRVWECSSQPHGAVWVHTAPGKWFDLPTCTDSLTHSVYRYSLQPPLHLWWLQHLHLHDGGDRHHDSTIMPDTTKSVPAVQPWPKWRWWQQWQW